jgi:hypothetical protein
MTTISRYLEAIDILRSNGKDELVRDFIKNKLLENDTYRQQVSYSL